MPERPILFYDGGCGLCHRAVRWFLRHDRRGVLRFAPLQGPTYAALDIPGKPETVDTMALLDDEGLHVRSDAVIRALRRIGGPWPAIAAVLRVIPRPVRDGAYGVVARRRMAWFGGAAACVAPAAADPDRFAP